MQESQEPEKSKSTLDRNQKLAIFVLAVFGFFIIVLWLVQFNKSLTEPFRYKGDDTASTTDQMQTASSSSAFDPTDPALKLKDTDGDGLSDWDELNVYQSSPYLFSTAGDGISDGVKVQKSEDPRCPENNQNCLATIDVIATSTVPADNSQFSTSSPIQTGTSTSNFQPNLSISSSTDDASLQTMLNGQMDAPTLRKTLLDSGMDPKVLNAMSDQVLMDNYQATLNNNTTTTNQ